MVEDLIQLDLFSNLNIPERAIQKTHTPIFEFITRNCLFYYGKTKPNQLQLERDIVYQGIKFHITITRARGIKNNKVIYDNYLNYQDEKLAQTLFFQCFNGQHDVVLGGKNVILHTSMYSILKDFNKGISKRFVKSSLDKLMNIKIIIEDECKTIELSSNFSILDYVKYDNRNEENKLTICFSQRMSDILKQEIKNNARKEIAMAKYRTLLDFRLPLTSYFYKTIMFYNDNFSKTDCSRQAFNQYNIWRLLKNGGFEYKTKFQKQNLKRMVKKAIEELEEKKVITWCDYFNPQHSNDITFYLTKETLNETFNQPQYPKTPQIENTKKLYYKK